MLAVRPGLGAIHQRPPARSVDASLNGRQGSSAPHACLASRHPCNGRRARVPEAEGPHRVIQVLR
eukprot:4978631-Pyramimonas_sp.AAC.1